VSMIFDTPEGIAFVRACSRKGALELEIAGMHRSGRRQTAYSIVKQVYGFRGNRKSVLADLTEYVEATLRLRALPPDEYQKVLDATRHQIEYLQELGMLDQPHFEGLIADGERIGAITHEFRQSMSDLFYVAAVSQNAGNR
jgi:hypothetical protein